MQTVLRYKCLAVVAALFAAPIQSVAAEPADARIGTWSHCVTTSEDNQNPVTENVTITFDVVGRGSHTTVRGVAADGSPIDVEFTAMFDGKDYPIKGAPWADTVSLRLINARTSIRTDKKDGKVVVSLKGVVSKDGKTFTITRKGVTPEGEQVVNTSVCERQS